MKSRLSLLVITKNAQDLLAACLKSVEGIVNEMIIIDNYSSDKTIEIAKKYGAKVYQHRENDLGRQKAYGLKKVSGDWVLNLDSDEVVSEGLRNEIEKFKTANLKLKVAGYYIPYQNHFLGHPINFGGENYKMLRLFKKDFIKIDDALVHEHFSLKSGETSTLKNKIYHYSYKSILQTYKKFTDYSFREARQKYIKRERSSLKKIFLYPIHMFWARFIKDGGYKDGLFRIPLDLGFAYMEFLSYTLLALYNFKAKK